MTHSAICRMYLVLSFSLLISLTSCAHKDIDDMTAPTVSGVTIVVIPKGEQHAFWGTVRKGAMSATVQTDKSAIAVKWVAPVIDDDVESQIELVRRIQESSGISGVVIAPLDEERLLLPIHTLSASGVEVVIMDSGLEGRPAESVDMTAQKQTTDRESDFVAFVGTNNFAAGNSAGRVVAEQCSPHLQKMHVIIMRYYMGSGSTKKRVVGFRNELRRMGVEEERFHVLQPTPEFENECGSWAATSSRAEVAAWMALRKLCGSTDPSITEVKWKRFPPNVKKRAQYKKDAAAELWTYIGNTASNGVPVAVFCPNESTSEGMLTVLQEMEAILREENKLKGDKGLFDGKIVFVGFDFSETLQEAVRREKIHALIVQDAYEIGRRSVERLRTRLSGDEGRLVEHVPSAVVTKRTFDDKKSREYQVVKHYLDR